MSELDQALAIARAQGRFLIVAVVGAVADDEAWARREIATPQWAEAVRPHSEVVVRADRNPTFCARFDVLGLPLFLLLDGEGREIGRLNGRQPATLLGRKLRRMADAASRVDWSFTSLAEHPEDAESAYWIATYRWNRGDRLLAVDGFERIAACAACATGAGAGAGAVDPRFAAGALHSLGEHYLDCGKPETAETHFRRAISCSQDEEIAVRSVIGLSMSLSRQGRGQEAIDVLEARLRAPGTDVLLDRLLFTAGYLHHEAGNLDSATRMFDECARRFPESPYAKRSERYLARRAGCTGAAVGVAVATPGEPAPQALNATSFSGSNFMTQELR